uniref:Uncharacterized protein n=1 Tax=Acrobeloides nanus TaxID=290746 RepID=A0A914CZA8_9BILA
MDRWTVAGTAIHLPNADHFMPTKSRFNPDQLTMEERRAIKESLNQQFSVITKRFNENPEVSNIFVVDSLLETLDEKVLKNAAVIRADFPILPKWVFEKISKLKLLVKKSVSIICCVGFDLLIYSTNNEPVYVIEYLQREISDLLDVVATEFANQVQLQLVFITIPEVNFVNTIDVELLDWAKNIAEAPAHQVGTVNKRIELLFGCKNSC